jgi:hypothetical protein
LHSDKGRLAFWAGFVVQQRSVLLIELSADAPFAGETQTVMQLPHIAIFVVLCS